jgi:CheY-like chemotaxis protein
MASSPTQLAFDTGMRARSEVASASHTVLWVDDDEEGADIARLFLSRLGYQVLIGQTAAHARSLLEANKVDLVLLDVMLPDMTGTALLRELRQHRAFQDLPVLMTTALNGPDDMVAALNGGANDYITKPFDFEVLAARIAAHLRTKTKHDWERQLQAGFSRALVVMGALGLAELWGESLMRWQNELLGELETVLPGRRIGIWDISDAAGMSLRAGTAAVEQLGLPQRKTLERTMAPLVQSGAVWLPVGDGTNIVAVVSIELSNDDYRDMLVRMARDFVRQLSVHIGASSSRLRRSSVQLPSPDSGGDDQVYVCAECHLVCSSSTRACPVHGASTHAWHSSLQPVIAERYHLERWLGEGGMGSVFQAFDPRLARHVAVKVLHPSLATNDDFRNRFVAEATLCARLKHHRIVDVYDFGQTPSGVMYIVMEWIDGTDLGVVLAQHGPGTPQQVAAVLEQCAQALDFAHRMGVVHRDVKPSNILLLQSERPEVGTRLVDFGVARRAASDRPMPGLVVGTPRYMPPEQVRGGKVGPGSDVFALAAVTFELLAGPQSNKRSASSQLVDPPIDLSHPLVQSAPTAFRSLLQVAFAPDLRDRPSQILPWALELKEVMSELRSDAPGWNLSTSS